MNDIYILYKQTESTKNMVTAFKNKLNASNDPPEGEIEVGAAATTVTLKNYVIKDYNDELSAEESYFEGNMSSVLLCFIDDEFFYDPNCRSIWSAFMSRQRNSKAQLVFPVLIEDVITVNFDNPKKEIYKTAKALGFYSIIGESERESLCIDIIESVKVAGKNDSETAHLCAATASDRRTRYGCAYPGAGLMAGRTATPAFLDTQDGSA